MVIFFLAFFPQFIHSAQGPQAAQMLILGAVFWIIGAMWDLAFACASGTIGTWLQHRPASESPSPAWKDSPTSASLAGQPSPAREQTTDPMAQGKRQHV
jgi:hypothetical protein